MFNSEMCNSVEKVVDMSNFWMLPEVTKVGFCHKIHTSVNSWNELCKIDEEFDKKSFKRIYFVEIHKRDGRILTQGCRTLKDLYEFLQWKTA